MHDRIVPDVPESKPLLLAVSAQKGLVTLLWLLAAAAWWWSQIQMAGMDEGPWTRLGPMSWFLLIWIVMMAAMMLPSVAPTVALYARMTSSQSPTPGLVFAAGYLITWAVSGLVVYILATIVNVTAGNFVAWEHAGRLLAAGILLLAAVYQLTPLKHTCLRQCRSPMGQIIQRWRDGPIGALRMGLVNGTWCVGCCWALMLALCALGIMSVTWMALVAAIIALEKLLPWQIPATYGTALILGILGILMLVHPDMIPGLTIPGSRGSVPMP